MGIVVCGSFSRGREKLVADYAELKWHFRVSSPVSLDWVDPDATYLRLPGQQTLSSVGIEKEHLLHINMAFPFVWLHCPEGYVGAMASLECGWALSKNKIIVSDVAPVDEFLAHHVVVLPMRQVIDVFKPRGLPR